jgi:hypothetical protein
MHAGELRDLTSMPTLPGEMKCIGNVSMAQWCNCSSLERNDGNLRTLDHMDFITEKLWLEENCEFKLNLA